LRPGPSSRRVDNRMESIMQSECDIEVFKDAARGSESDLTDAAAAEGENEAKEEEACEQ